ncbi:MAG TPA: hypothetical protein VFC44_06640 [Candidatus Saccharimonadales bacterium]|nr:hypothetical protein [Candidatus Saccharimonadales bacterium]
MAPKKVIFLAGAIFLLLISTARAALQFDVFVGYDNLLPTHGWFPVICELHNDGPSFNAVIDINTAGWGGQTRQFPIDLPTGTRKRVVIPVYATALTWNARLVDSRGQVLAEQTSSFTRVAGSNLPLVAGLARTVAGLPVFPEKADRAGQSPVTVARLQPALFPDNPIALEGVDLLYLNSAKAAELSIGQVNALIEWLQNGGHLVVAVEQVGEVNGTPWLRDLLPCELTSTISVDEHDSLQEWLSRRLGLALVNDQNFNAAPLQVAVGRQRGGRISIGDKTAPLAMEATRGRGLLTVLCFSPEREPFISWKNRAWFWANLAEIPSSVFEMRDRGRFVSQSSSDGIFGAMIDTTQVRKLPLSWLLALLGAYLVVIGPLDQYSLKKLNRQMLTWITFPCYVLIFSGLIYWIGFHLRAGELEWNELSVVDILPDSDRAVLRGQTYVSIYSPVNANYKLASDHPFAALRGESAGNFGVGQEGSRLTVVQRGNSFEAEAFVPVWTSQLYVSDWVQPAPLPVKMTISGQTGSWDVTVENKMDHALQSACVVLSGRVFTLGELPAAQSKTFALKWEMGKSLALWTRRSGQAFARAVASRHNSFGNNGGRIVDLASSTMAASFLSQLNEEQNTWQQFSSSSELDLSRFAADGHAILMAWDAGHSAASGLNRFSVRRMHRNTLFRLVTLP